MNVYTIGTFDMLHEGHLNLLKTARKLAGPDGQVIVGINNDGFVTTFKKQAPVQNQWTRLRVVEALRGVDHTFLHNGLSYAWFKYRTGDGARPGVLLVGSDWAKKNYLRQLGVSQSDLDGFGLTLVYAPYTKGISTTLLRKRVRK